MAETRVELRVSFTVSSDRDKGREAAEHAIHAIDYLATHGQLDDCYDFEVTKGSVNGNAWNERWPDVPPQTAPPGHHDLQQTAASLVAGVVARAAAISDVYPHEEPHAERLAECVRDLAKVVYLLVPKDA